MTDEKLALLLRQHAELCTGRWITDLANTSSFIFHEVPHLNWVGFYLLEGQTLFLGPFQGKPACTEIPLGKGVCGKSALLKRTVCVPDVSLFEGHIVCDPASQSELVVPLVRNSQLLGVLDIDSSVLNRFQESDQRFFEQLVQQLLKLF